MQKFLITLMIVMACLILTACSTSNTLNEKMLAAADNLPGVYKIDVRQGNLITQEMINQLRPGMNKRQVTFILGTPLLVDPFHKDRWDYFYDLKTAGKQNKQERITVFFADNKLVNLKGNFKPSNQFQPMLINTEVVDVPKREKEEQGLIEKTLHSLGIEYDEKF